MGGMSCGCCHAVCYCILLIVIAALSVVLHFWQENTNPNHVALPSLSNQPEVWGVTTSSIWVGWYSDHDGDGPVCGHNIYLQYPASTSWSSVGFVPADETNDYQFTIDRLDAGTLYGISVRILHCSGREGERNQLYQATNDYVLPRLFHPPNVKSIGTSYAVVRWQEQHTGDGPICAYAIDRRSLDEDVPSWLSVGFVSEQPGSQSREELVFNLTDLEPETDYHVSVRPILCDRARISELGKGPILSLTTPSIVLPTLMEAPESTNLSSKNVSIRWTNQHQGDGPICGYGINIKTNDDKDREDDDDPWRSVGYVSMESELLYDVGHLEENTTYQVAVSPINCISAREGPREPILQFTTKTVTVPVVVLPSLSHPPNTTAIGTSYAVVQWQEQHTGDGPICAYTIDRRSLDEDITSWLSVGFVSEQPGSQSREELIFNITGLEPETDYHVSVRPILCDGARISELSEGPILSLTTPSIVLPTLMEAPQSTNLSSTNVSIRWTNQHQGDGPICGYGINIKNNDDKDREDDDDDPWRSVGYVSVESELLYDVGHLEENTPYQVAVSPINCISAREGPREPILQFTTKTVTVPVVEVLTTEPLFTEPQKTEPKRVPTSGASICPEHNCTVVVVLLILGYYLSRRGE
eukprot:XP_003730871.1 PREDICTED: uncharacterized protein LOC100889398 isoform X1 [Strongylocentrotus purpuratus]